MKTNFNKMWAPPSGWFKAAIDGRDAESVFFSLIDGEEQCEKLGLPSVKATYDLSFSIVSKNDSSNE